MFVVISITAPVAESLVYFPMRAPLYILQRGVQWKQGVVVCMALYTCLLYNTTPIHCTPDPLHPSLQSIHPLVGRDPAVIIIIIIILIIIIVDHYCYNIMYYDTICHAILYTSIQYDMLYYMICYTIIQYNVLLYSYYNMLCYNRIRDPAWRHRIL